MNKTLHGTQIAHRCAGLILSTSELCGEPAPYLINGSTFCPLHALALARILMDRTGEPPGTTPADHGTSPRDA